MRDDYGAGYARLYSEHWWWRAREAILLDLVKAIGLPPDAEVLDVGCGDGLFFPRLEAHGRVRGIEVDENLLNPSGPYRDRISTRPLGDPVYDGDGWRFDLIAALDVIEHIEDDRSAVGSMAGMLRPGGTLLITVPAFRALWDQHDEINFHYRRYTASTLRATLAGSGLELVQVRYLFPALFAPKLLVKLLNLVRRRKVSQHGIPPKPVSRVMTALCLGEDRLLRRLPVAFGTSVLAVARKAGPVPSPGRGRPEPSAAVNRTV